MLRDELDDAMVRLAGSPEVLNMQVADTFAAYYSAIQEEVGHYDLLGADVLKPLAKSLTRAARRDFGVNPGIAYGKALLAIHLESRILPGEDAAFVRQVTEQMLGAANEVRSGINTLEQPIP